MEQHSALEWFIEQLEQKGDVRETVSIRNVQINIDTSDYLALKRQAKEMEKQNEKNACLLAISQYMYKQAVQENEKKDKEKIKITEDKDKIEEQDKIRLVSICVEGVITKVNEQWMVSHNLIDPYSQVPIQLPIHKNSYYHPISELNLKEIFFDIVFQNNEYFALI